MRIGKVTLNLDISYVVDLDIQNTIELAKEWIVEDLLDIAVSEGSGITDYNFLIEERPDLTEEDIYEGIQQYIDYLKEEGILTEREEK
mgnify:CR=1 FL=1